MLIKPAIATATLLISGCSVQVDNTEYVCNASAADERGNFVIRCIQTANPSRIGDCVTASKQIYCPAVSKEREEM